MKVGLHVSVAGGFGKAIERAQAYGAECFQFFSRSPRGGAAPKISHEDANAFKEKLNDSGLECYIHTPYYINFASRKPAIAQASIRIVREELQRGSQLGVKYVMTHLGSAREWANEAEARAQVAAGLKKIYEQGDFSTELLLEISAGAGAVVGDTLKELGQLLEEVGRDDLHVCLDTCHLFASGYDLRNEEGIAATVQELTQEIGQERFKLLHVNDSKGELGSHKDRHAHIGQGEIGVNGFKALLKDNVFNKVNWILETHHDDDLPKDIAFLKEKV